MTQRQNLRRREDTNFGFVSVAVHSRRFSRHQSWSANAFITKSVQFNGTSFVTSRDALKSVSNKSVFNRLTASVSEKPTSSSCEIRRLILSKLAEPRQAQPS